MVDEINGLKDGNSSNPNMVINIEALQDKIRASMIKNCDYGAFEATGTSFQRSSLAEENRLLSVLQQMSSVTNQSWDIIPLTSVPAGNRLKRFMKRVHMKIFGWPARQYFRTQTDCNGHFVRQQNEMISLLTNLTARMEAQNEKIIAQDAEITVLGAKLQKTLNMLHSDDANIFDRMDRAEQGLFKAQDKIFDIEERLGLQTEVEFDYAGFEDRYRGTEESIRNRLEERYLHLFRNRTDIMDIGCGRGEFLSLLKENGISAQGVDSGTEMVQRCNDKGLSVIEANAIDYMNESQAESYGGIMCSQMIEHISASELMQLVRSCHRALTDGGILVLETINPLSLATYRFSYPMDLTHRHMIHPFTLQYILQSVGFSKVELAYFSPARDKMTFPADTPEDMTRFFEEIQNCLFSEQDYAVIAIR
jgi:O-antigen chain-terminating methyltransferase